MKKEMTRGHLVVMLSVINNSIAIKKEKSIKPSLYWFLITATFWTLIDDEKFSFNDKKLPFKKYNQQKIMQIAWGSIKK